MNDLSFVKMYTSLLALREKFFLKRQRGEGLRQILNKTNVANMI